MENLMNAARMGDVDALYASMRLNSKILEEIDEFPMVDTPLHMAASEGRTIFAIEIMSLKPSFGRKLNPDGLSPLHLAVLNCHFDTVKRLVEFDKELIRVKGRERLTPLHYLAKRAERCEQVDLLAEFLYACPESIEDVTVRKETAVHIVVKNNRETAFNALLAWLQITRNTSVLSTVDDQGNTVLHIAVFTSQLKIVKALVKLRGKKLKNQKNLDGNTALDIALRGGANNEAAKALIKAKAPKSSSLRKNFNVVQFLESMSNQEKLFGLFLLTQKGLSMEMRNTILVVAVLIATATFQAVLSPPDGGSRGGGEGEGGGVLHPNNSAIINGTMDKMFNTTTTTTKGAYSSSTEEKEQARLFTLFFYPYTAAFIASMLVILVVLPHWRFFSLLLHASLTFLVMSYGVSLLLISSSAWNTCTFMIVPLVVAVEIYWLGFKEDDRLEMLQRVIGIQINELRA